MLQVIKFCPELLQAAMYCRLLPIYTFSFCILGFLLPGTRGIPLALCCRLSHLVPAPFGLNGHNHRMFYLGIQRA